MNELKPPVNPDDIATRDDRFLCTPMGVTIFANACARRQAMVRGGIRALEMQMCKACALGAIVERNSGGPVPLSDVAQRQVNKMGHALRTVKPFDDSPGPSKYAKRALKVLPGGARDADVVTLPTVGEGIGGSAAASKAIELPRPKAPPGREPPTFPESSRADVNPPVRAGGLGKGVIVSSAEGLMVERHGQAPAGPFPNEEAAARAAGSIDTVAEEVPPALKPETKEETTMAKTEEERRLEAKREYNRAYYASKRSKAAQSGKPVAVAVAKPKAKPWPKPGRRSLLAGKPAPSRPVAEHVTPPTQLSLQQAVEACDLVSRIGWDRARSLAAMLDEVRTEATGTE
jgi:hypothetical protein